LLLPGTKSNVYAKKVAKKLEDRSQGSYMVCHFSPLRKREVAMADDPPHKIEGQDVNDRKKLLELMYQNRYQFNTLRQARHATMMCAPGRHWACLSPSACAEFDSRGLFVRMLFYFLGHRQLRSSTERIARAAMMNERVAPARQSDSDSGSGAMVAMVAQRNSA